MQIINDHFLWKKKLNYEKKKEFKLIPKVSYYF